MASALDGRRFEWLDHPARWGTAVIPHGCWIYMNANSHQWWIGCAGTNDMWFRWPETARQLRLLWGHVKYTVQFCEVFMIVCDLQTYSCFELSTSSNVQEKHNILEDGCCFVLRWWGSGKAPTLVDSLENQCHPLDQVTEDGANFRNMLHLYIR